MIKRLIRWLVEDDAYIAGFEQGARYQRNIDWEVLQWERRRVEKETAHACWKVTKSPAIAGTYAVGDYYVMPMVKKDIA